MGKDSQETHQKQRYVTEFPDQLSLFKKNRHLGQEFISTCQLSLFQLFRAFKIQDSTFLPFARQSVDWGFPAAIK